MDSETSPAESIATGVAPPGRSAWAAGTPTSAAVIVDDLNARRVADLNGVARGAVDLILRDDPVAVQRRPVVGVGPDAVAADAVEPAQTDVEVSSSLFQKNPAGGVAVALGVEGARVLDGYVIDIDAGTVAEEYGKAADLLERNIANDNLLRVGEDNAVRVVELGERDVGRRKVAGDGQSRAISCDLKARESNVGDRVADDRCLALEILRQAQAGTGSIALDDDVVSARGKFERGVEVDRAGGKLNAAGSLQKAGA